MRPLFLSPHSDDETLFGSYTLLRHNPEVIICLRGTTQTGISYERRATEANCASWWLGIDTPTHWPCDDGKVDWDEVRSRMKLLAPRDQVFAPMVELGGHHEHNMIGGMADEVFGWENVTHYATYVRGHGRSQTETQVSYEPDWPAKKFKAMACYVTQINLDNTRPWFSDWDREWYE